MDPRSVRVFLSSTFRDFQEERTLLAGQVFPKLRGVLRRRFVELIDIDLRWGITEEQSKRGEVLPICLAEIDRARPDDVARPYFIGMLGERYGWTPAVDEYGPDLIKQYPWLEDHLAGKSVTELEILHGVLNDPTMRGRAFFYFRDPDFANEKGADFQSESPDDELRLIDLKKRIEHSPHPVRHYSTPAELAAMVSVDLQIALDLAIPPSAIPDEFERDELEHRAYGDRRARHHVGGSRYFGRLDQALVDGHQTILVAGGSGSGKSSLLARWLARRRLSDPKDMIVVHHLAASTDASQSETIVLRLLETIRRKCRPDETIPSETDQQIALLPVWLAVAADQAAEHEARWIWVLDGLDGLSDGSDLHWLPSFLPERTHLVVSALDGPVKRALLRSPRRWQIIDMEPLDERERRDLLTGYIERYGKKLPDRLLADALRHSLSGNPLFLTTLAEELRLFGSHEGLSTHLQTCLESRGIDDLFARVLERLEIGFGLKSIRSALQRIWISRAGLAEKEIQSFCNILPIEWAGIRAAMEIALVEAEGRITFSHQFVKQAVKARYLIDDDEVRRIRLSLARSFRKKAIAEQVIDGRCAEEEPFQLARAGEFAKLKKRLLEPRMLTAIIRNRGLSALLGYWLQIERAGAGNLEADHCEAWTGWVDRLSPKTVRGLNERLSNFLEFSRRSGDFSLMVTTMALADVEAEYGPGHEKSLMRRSRLARVLIERGELADAAQHLNQAVDGLKKLGMDHSTQYAVRLAELAEIYLSAGLLRSAIKTAHSAVELSERLPQSPSAKRTLWRALLAKGLALMDMENFCGAMQCISKANKIARAGKSLPGRHQAVSLIAMGRVFLEVASDDGIVNGASSCFEIADTLLVKSFGPQHPEVLLAVLGKASVEAYRNEPGEVRRHLDRASEILAASIGPVHPYRALVLHARGRLAFDQGDWPAARQHLEEAARVRRQLGGFARPLLAQTLDLLAQNLRKMGDEEAALTADEECSGIRARFPLFANAGAAASLTKAGVLHDEQGNPEIADRFYARAATHEDQIGPKSRHRQARIHIRCATRLRQKGLTERANFRLKRAEGLLLELLESSPDDTSFLADLAACREPL